MLFCKYTIECIKYNNYFDLRTYYISYRNKNENSNKIFVIVVNGNLLYLKTCSPF